MGRAHVEPSRNGPRTIRIIVTAQPAMTAPNTMNGSFRYSRTSSVSTASGGPKPNAEKRSPATEPANTNTNAYTSSNPSTSCSQLIQKILFFMTPLWPAHRVGQ